MGFEVLIRVGNHSRVVYEKVSGVIVRHHPDILIYTTHTP